MTTSELLKNIGRAVVVFAIASNAQGATTDIATSPLVTSSTTSVLPNLMFVLDDSGSMAWSYMPDDAGNFAGRYGYASSQCNGVYYDHTITYIPPVDSSGASYPNASFTGAWKDGYNTSAGTVNLSTSFQAYGGDTAQAAYYYSYSGSQTTAAQKDFYNTSSTFYLECNSNIGSAPGNTKFTKVTVGAGEQQNFANWYSYYRTRILMMKTAAGLAFKPVDNHYRVGFMTINNNASPAFLNLATFDSAQKSAWYTKLYSSTANNSTPLRETLANVGRIYAGKVTSMYGVTVTDPIQYSCQQNFTILSTDGFWNGTDSNVKKIDGTTTMDNQDGSAARPFYDGSTNVTVTTTVSTSEARSATTCSGGRPNKITVTTTTTTRTVTTGLDGTVISDITTGPTSTNTTLSCSNSDRALQSPNPSNPTTTTTTSSSGPSNTLADVAQYYYMTDLRDSSLGNAIGAMGTDVSQNNVPSSGQDAASWQHMTTFTLGLGARGRMIFSPSYLSDASGDYFAVKNGSTANPGGGVCSWGTSGNPCNWPTPAANQPEAIDDLWHAAVNGRGTYFSATNPSSLATALSSALAGVSARTGASAAATTSNPNVTSGDNFVFSSTFTTQEWDGQLVRQQLDLSTGIASSTIDWSAQSQLDNNASRTIYTYDSAAASHLKPFLWANLTATEQAYFTTPAISSLSQFCATGATCLSAAAQTSAAGANLVSFLRGDRTNEGPSTDTSKYYRQRTHVLGDIVNAEAVYVKGAMYSYSDWGYSDFKTANASRQGMVYAAANDGMLHAFNASTGAESWAYIPSLVLPNLYKLADKNYSNLHQYFVDGTPTFGDICISNCATPTPPATLPVATWKTILVGGLNGGGRGYYALDITDPTAPKVLWEFTDTNLGYTFGNPEIAKLKDGTWVVLIASGYNNVSPGDGLGRLYVLNAATGAVIRAISTGVGSTATPSGLARIRAWADNAMYDNTALRVYGGDLLGNLWRFDINGDVGAAGYDAQLLATLRGASGNIQPITAKPELGDVGGNAIVFVGTGRYLGATDLADTSQQTLYAIKDNLGSTSYGNPRTSGSFVQQTYTVGTCPAGTPSTICHAGEIVRTSSSNTVNFAVNNGWYGDLPDSGERANTDPTLGLGTIEFNTNTPNASACTVGGYSQKYFLDYRTGGAVSTASGVVGRRLGNALSTRPVFVRLPNNTIVDLTRLSDGTTVTSNVPIGSGASVTHRISWRELVTDQ